MFNDETQRDLLGWVIASLFVYVVVVQMQEGAVSLTTLVASLPLLLLAAALIGGGGVFARLLGQWVGVKRSR